MRSKLLLPLTLFLTLSLFACVPVEQKRSDAESAEYHYLMGVTALKEQDPTTALKEFLDAEKLNSSDPQIHAGLAEAYMQKNALDQAEIHFKRAIDLSENNPKLHNNLGALYLSMDRYDEAISSFSLAANNLLFDRPELAWAGIGLAYVQKQDYPAAQNAYQKAMDANPRYFRAPFMLGELYFTLDRPVEALEMFNRSISIAPGFANGYYWQGLVYMKMKETDKAKQAFLKVLELAPNTDVSRLAANYLKIINE